MPPPGRSVWPLSSEWASVCLKPAFGNSQASARRCECVSFRLLTGKLVAPLNEKDKPLNEKRKSRETLWAPCVDDIFVQ